MGGGELSGVVGFMRLAFNRARGSWSGKFAAQDGAKARAAKNLVPVAFSRARWRFAQTLSRGKPAVNLPRVTFATPIGDALSK
jgi:hypothetical protein